MDKLKKIKNMLKNPKTKSLIFFGFYIIFFLVIIILFRTPAAKEKATIKKIEPYYNLGKIEDANYHFKYLEEISDRDISYEGDRNGVRQLFIKKENDIVESFYGYESLFMKKENTNWIKTDNPYYYSGLLEIENIKKLLKRATYISKTEYENTDISYSYQISTSTIVEILEKNQIDLDDLPNTISLLMNADNYVKEIDYDISSYATYKDINNKDVKISLVYSDFGNIKEIEEVN